MHYLCNNMKRIFFTIIYICFAISLCAQFLNIPTSKSKKDSLSNKIKVWNVDEIFGVADTIVVDTLVTSYQDNQPINNYSIAPSWNGNLGSLVQSKIFFDRNKNMYDDMFAESYSPYTILPNKVAYYDTKMPFSQLVYRTALPTYREEDYLKVLLTLNANKHLNIGGLCNFIYGRGQYQNQSSQMVNGGFWTSYTGKKYEFVASVMFNSYKNLENGGVANYDYILDPVSSLGVKSINAYNIPVKFKCAQTRYRNFSYFFTHRYNIGKVMDVVVNKDSVVKKFQPIIILSHTFKASDVRRKYLETDSITGDFYVNNYYSGKYTDDSVSYFSISNIFAVTLDEKFNRILRFGFRAFVEYDVRHYGMAFDTLIFENKYTHNIRIGADLYKKEGKYFKYDFGGKLFLLGPYIGDFDVYGNLKGHFFIKKEPFDILARASFYRYTPYHWYQNYNSNHFKWNNDFSHPLALDIEGRFSVPKRDISIGVNFRNITNYLFLNKECVPEQYDGNVQVLAVDLTANLKFWRFHLDTKAVYQLTSNKNILPLPDFAVYSNFYYMDKFFKVLTVQIGVDIRYHTAYYANAYMPALGQYYIQDKLLIGNYPQMNVYANFHLKTMRFFVQYYHWNKGLFGGNNYFSSPGYPINPGTFQFGLSWNFWN